MPPAEFSLKINCSWQTVDGRQRQKENKDACKEMWGSVEYKQKQGNGSIKTVFCRYFMFSNYLPAHRDTKKDLSFFRHIILYIFYYWRFPFVILRIWGLTLYPPQPQFHTLDVWKDHTKLGFQTESRLSIVLWNQFHELRQAQCKERKISLIEWNNRQ